jgi:hypothetical protein
MMKRTLVFLGLLGAGFAVLSLLQGVRRRRRINSIHLTTEDLDYQDLSPRDLDSSHLLDLNDASESDLQRLGLSAESLQRLIENRPYRSKLELVSRMVLTEAEFSGIRDKVAIAEGREPVKIA